MASGPEGFVQLTEPAPKDRTEKIELISIALIRQSRYQVRDEAFEDIEALQNLAESIRAVGLLEAPIVRRCDDDRDCFELISGHRRVRAISKYLGWNVVRCIIREDVDEITTFRLGMAENIHRNNLSAYEEGIAYLLCQKLFGFSVDQLMEMFNRSRTTIVSRCETATGANDYLQLVSKSDTNRFLRNFTLAHRDILGKLREVEAKKQVVKMIAQGASVRNIQRYVDFMGYVSESASPRTKESNSINSVRVGILEAALKSIGELKEDVPKHLSTKVTELEKSLKRLNSFLVAGQREQQLGNLSGVIGGKQVTYEDLLNYFYSIQPGTHFVLMYEDPLQGEIFSLLYLLQGLIRGENAVYMTEEDPISVRASMARHGIDVKYYESEKRTLYIHRVADALQHPEGFIASMREIFGYSLPGVRQPCRVVMSPTLTVDTEGGGREFLRLSSKKIQNTFKKLEGDDETPCDLFKKFRCSLMCRYIVRSNHPRPYVKWVREITSNHDVSVYVATGATMGIILHMRQ